MKSIFTLLFFTYFHLEKNVGICNFIFKTYEHESVVVLGQFENYMSSELRLKFNTLLHLKIMFLP